MLCYIGGGSIPLEALRVGADAFASDLNPVAVLLNKVVLEYISAGSVNMDDIAQRGVFAFLPDAFFDCENLYLKIWDLKRPGEIIRVPIPNACIEQICVDFEPYMDMLRAKEAELLLPHHRRISPVPIRPKKHLVHPARAYF